MMLAKCREDQDLTILTFKHFEDMSTDTEKIVTSSVLNPDNSSIRGIPGQQLLQFAGAIHTEDLKLMRQIIEEGCEQVDLNEWLISEIWR